MTIMATTPPRKRGRPPAPRPTGPLLIEDWLGVKPDSPESIPELAEKLKEDRTAVWKWIRQPTRLDPIKQARVAIALGLPTPMLLWCKPGSQMAQVIEAMMAGEKPEGLPKVPQPPRK